ncbi:LacI family DNA-binding transcriptional regulator [Paracoccus sp. (in: a-proteobacteria)]|uniref:LacI family DNA-binding transcriptional regulator n=1 Tax=Paracoccus sp. TaxID=267 RepID=UPI00321FFA4B
MAEQRSIRKRRKIQGVTMMDVARAAGVSPSTVSLFLRRPEAVSAAAGEAVQAAIRQLNYVPNLIAGGLAAASSRVVGVIVPSVRNAFFAETVAALQRDLGRARLQMLLGHSEYDPQTEEDLVRATLSWAPAAIVLTGLGHAEATRAMLKAAAIPVVQIWELGRTQPIDAAVGFHHDQVGAAAARHLVARGCRALVYLSGRTHQDRRAAQRAAGFLAAARELGVPVRHLGHPAPATVEQGGILFAQLLAEAPAVQPLGIGCSNDLLALGVLFEAQRRGRRIPEEFAVIGFGDMGFAASSNPALSTIRPAGDLIGSEAARLIVARLATPELAAPERREAGIIDTGFSVMHRQST